MDKAFTFIELIIVITVTTLLSGIALVNYQRIGGQEKLQKDAKQFERILFLAKEKASAAETLQCDSTDPGIGELIGFKVDLTSNDYYLIEVCQNQEFIISAQHFSPSISAINNTSVTFRKSDMGITSNVIVSFGIRSILINNNNCRSYDVSPSGAIDELSPYTC
ncbi:hypothetical protein A2966_03700 [Candidatus Roizmanbacteria bacterium RIFCSPLOWO2_01_FULL_41_22]|uniref:General secretion pathway GspH domain-containing protein n=2 Tax=Candidatus Roizmaniibacteriota TaxID=1752723 RepID=A0A1F7JQ46_9BACT|nr:MAG: hypothetical protein A2966_03700 [Candidatus Roizmanbacteria bacterium RIFCSPLOWO2_01_FULL_41_22]OGK57731.1 MAG: hypothetical protein A3H86_03385 [Candidatus Roizmanbacteria bacterium RIFCSPLOWO2_02_FULL_41_9]